MIICTPSTVLLLHFVSYFISTPFLVLFSSSSLVFFLINHIPLSNQPHPLFLINHIPLSNQPHPLFLINHIPLSNPLSLLLLLFLLFSSPSLLFTNPTTSIPILFLPLSIHSTHLPSSKPLEKTSSAPKPALSARSHQYTL